MACLRAVLPFCNASLAHCTRSKANESMSLVSFFLVISRSTRCPSLDVGSAGKRDGETKSKARAEKKTAPKSCSAALTGDASVPNSAR